MTVAKIIDVLTGEETEIQYTPEEIAQMNAEAIAYANAEKAKEDAKAAEKEAIAARLGLSADELKTLLS